jgi:DNA-binding transcriptional LysR family regulator
MNLQSFDLNLMVAFDALMSHRQVTKAGIAIGSSQPAMSNALARLRLLLDDELLVKSRTGMVPTAKALAAHDQIRRALVDIENAIAGDNEFNPSQSERTFTVAMVEHAAFILMPKLVCRLALEAPLVNLNVISFADTGGIELLDTDQCELSIGLIRQNMPDHILSDRLYDEKFVCMMRPGHAVVEGPFSLDDYLSYPHISVLPSRNSISQIDRALSLIGRERRVVVTISNVLLIHMLLEGSDMIASLPERNALHFAPSAGLEVRELPFNIPPFEAHLAWHGRLDSDPGHQWLRGLIKVIAKDV